jgi:hypothetical protein
MYKSGVREPTVLHRCISLSPPISSINAQPLIKPYADDSFQAWEQPEQRPYRNWDAIKLYEPNQGTHEQQYYDTTKDLTYMYSRIPGGPGGGPGTPSQLFILPQKKDGRIYSARLEGKEAHGCKEGKSLILQASLIAGNATSDKQSGVWPAFWALGKSLKDKTQPWPLCGEWDIFETSSGHDWSLGTVHYGVVGNDGKAQDHIVGSEKNKFDHTQYHTWALKVDRTNSDWSKQTLQCS